MSPLDAVVVVEREIEEEGEKLERENINEKETEEEGKEEERGKDLEKGKARKREETSYTVNLNRLNPTNPLRILINGGSRLTTPIPKLSQPRQASSRTPHHHHLPRSALSSREESVISLNSAKYTNKLSLFLFMVHMVMAIALVLFLTFKAIQGLIGEDNSIKRKEKRLLKLFFPQVETASFLSITLAIFSQKAFRQWPTFMAHFILWSTFLMSMSAGILLICFQNPPTDAIGVCLIAFSIGNGLYACSVNQRIKFSCKILMKSLEPVSKFPDLNQPTYYMLLAGFLWMSLCVLAIIGALNFYFPPLIITALVLSLAWTTEVMRNVVSLTVSRAVSLYYLRGMQLSTQSCLVRALTRNLGSACLGSLFVPAIEGLRIVARGLNLVEGEDEFMFSCARCCLGVLEFIFRRGNGWAFVQIAAYGKGFVDASQDTWEMFEQQQIVGIVDSDITSSIWFLAGVCSGSVCVIVAAAWTTSVHKPFTATVSLLAFFLGYLVTRIAMALPQACVSCYYTCYAENPSNSLFDKTIEDRLDLLKSGRDTITPTPRLRPQSSST